MKTLLSISILVILWWSLSMLVGSDVILPDPLDVLKELWLLFTDPVFYDALLATIWKGLLSAALVMAVGIPVGFVMGMSETVMELLHPIVVVVQAVPVVSWLTLAVFMWGIGWKGPIFITFLSLLPVVIFNTASGVSSTDRRLVEMAEVFKVPRWRIFKTIYLGSLVPFSISSLRIVMGNVWKTTVVTEFLCGDRGLGVLIAWARSYVNSPRVYATTLVVITVAISLEKLTEGFVRRLTTRWRSF